MKKKGLIIGVILLIIIIAIVCLVALKNRGYSEEEIAEFNNVIENYVSDSMEGTEVTNLLSKLIENVKTNQKNEDFLPTVEFESSETSIVAEGADTAVENSEDYVEALSDISETIYYRNDYEITLEYAETGIVNKVNITEGINLARLDSLTISSFNSIFEQNYEGSKLGASVRSLISILISNAASYAGQEDFLPTVEVIDQDDNVILVEGGSTAAEDGDTYTESLTELRTSIINSHYYSVELKYSDSSIINEIIITY